MGMVAFGGFCAETSGALTLFGATLAGIPVSTTHTITGAIVGVGATRRLSAVRWGVAQRILWVGVNDSYGGVFSRTSFLCN
jgi:PiT family inorganic phosphate transporter